MKKIVIKNKMIRVSFLIMLCYCSINGQTKSSNMKKKISQKRNSKDMVYHYSVLDALRNGVYLGNLMVQELAKKGDFGLGTYNQLDGEMVVLDRNFYRVASDGKVTKPGKTWEIPFASVVFFVADSKYEVINIDNLEMLFAEIKKRLHSANRPYAIKIECTFETVVVGAAKKVDKGETEGLSVLMKTRPLFEKKNVKGTMVGFYNPDYASGIDLSPFHFHFISDDKLYGGHLISGTLSPEKIIKVSIDEKSGYEVDLPQKNSWFDRSWSTEKINKSSY